MVHVRGKILCAGCICTMLLSHCDNILSRAVARFVLGGKLGAITNISITRRTVVLENMENKTRHTVPYAFLHAVPPQPPPPPLRAAIGTKLVNAQGYVDVYQFTLTNKHYPNVWGVGDCMGIPSSKTAAAACMSHFNHMRSHYEYTYDVCISVLLLNTQKSIQYEYF